MGRGSLFLILGTLIALTGCGSSGGGGGGKSDATPGFAGLYVLEKAYAEFEGADQSAFCETVNSHPTLHGVNPTDNNVKSKPDILQITNDNKVMRYAIDKADTGAKNPDGELDAQGNFKMNVLYANQYPIGQARTNHLEDGNFSFKTTDGKKYLVFWNNRSWGTRTYLPVSKKDAEAYLNAVSYCASKITPIDYGVE